MSANKSKKKNRKVMSLGEFHDEVDQQQQQQQNQNQQTSQAKNWAEVMEEQDQDSTEVVNEALLVRQTLPTAPRSVLGPDIDLELVPKQKPFRANVSNISFEADEDKLREWFKELKVENIHLFTTDRGTGHKGFGYVEFEDRESLLNALAKTEQPFMNRKLKISLPNVKDNQNSRGGGGGNNSNSNDSHGGNVSKSDMDDMWRKEQPSDDVDNSYSNSSSNNNNTQRRDYYDNRQQNRRGFGGNRPPYQQNRQQGGNRGGGGGGSNVGNRGNYQQRQYNNNDSQQQQQQQGNNENRGYQRRQQRLSDNSQRDRSNERQLDETSGSSEKATTGEAEITRERPKLNLQPRTKPLEIQEPGTTSSIFGGARPVDTAARERMIEEKLKAQAEAAKVEAKEEYLFD